MIRAVFFDMDGTVLDTLSTITHYVNAVLKANGILEISEEECKSFIGNGARLLIERALKSRGVYEESLSGRLLSEYNAAYDKRPSYKTDVYEGIFELISMLKASGIKLGILSNKPDFVTRPLAFEFFGESFDFVRGAVDGVPLKPDPASLISSLSSLGVEPSECVYVGDTSVDILTGKAAGVALTVGVLWGFRGERELRASGADLIVSEPKEIYDEVIRID